MAAHPNNWRARCRQILACSLVIGTASNLYSQEPVETAPPFEPPQLSPSLADFVTGMPISYKMKKMFTPKLMRPPFAGAPVDTVKGLASKIKAQQVDARNRVQAVRFLATVDCVAYPESQAMLIDRLQNDPSERVRLEAAEALGEQFNRGRDEGLITTRREKRRYDFCRGCCSEMAMNALSAVAYDVDEAGCALEPSERVREAAIEALSNCVDCCTEEAAPALPPEPMEEESPLPPPEEERAADAAPALSPVQQHLLSIYERNGQQAPPEFTPVETSAEAPAETAEAPADDSLEFVTPVLIDNAEHEATADEPQDIAAPLLISTSATQTSAELDNSAPQVPLPCLRGYCPVGLTWKRLEKGHPEIYTDYDGHRYHFASTAAKARFEAAPDLYVPVMQGADPVHLKSTGEVRQGKYISLYDGRLYFFLTKENRSRFRNKPALFALYAGE